MFSLHFFSLSLLLGSWLVHSTPLASPTLQENHTKSRQPLMPPMQTTSAAQSQHHSSPVNNLKPVCTGENISRLISTNLLVLRKALQVAVATHGVGPTRELIQEVFGESSAVTESIENNESSSLDDEEIHVLDTQEIVNPKPHIVNLEDPMLEATPKVDEHTPSMSWQAVATGPHAPLTQTNQVVRYASPSHPSASGAETVLIIPGHRIRPQASKVRISAKNKNREVKIASIPHMSIYDALRAAEQKIQRQYPELSNTKVIDFYRRESSPTCFAINRVGPVENDEIHSWFIKVTTKSGDLTYKGLCVPSAEAITIRSGSNIDLVFTPTAIIS